MNKLREKLVKLLRNAKAAMKSENLSCDLARNMFVADFMIANGVTVQGGKDTDVPTNADRIRAMSDEELADYFGRDGYSGCPEVSGCRAKCDGLCRECWAKWLKEPVEEVEDG